MAGFLIVKVVVCLFKMEDIIIAAVEQRHGIRFKPFQRSVCHRVLKQEDIFICATTCSGKTFCFAFMSELLELKSALQYDTPMVVKMQMMSL